MCYVPRSPTLIIQYVAVEPGSVLLSRAGCARYSHTAQHGNNQCVSGRALVRMQRRYVS